MSDLSNMEEELRELQKIMTTKGHWIGWDQWIYCYKHIEEMRGLIRRRKMVLHMTCGYQKPPSPPQAGGPNED